MREGVRYSKTRLRRGALPDHRPTATGRDEEKLLFGEAETPDPDQSISRSARSSSSKPRK